MCRYTFGLLVLTVLVVSCAAPNHVEQEQASPDEKTERNIPRTVRQIQRVDVWKVHRYLWDSDEVTLNFITTKDWDGDRVALLAGFPRTAKMEPYAYLRLGAGERQVSYRLTLGSPFCQELATSLAFTGPSVIPYSDPVDHSLIPERVRKLRELLRGSYVYKSPPP
jgi:hypothetical protein